MLPGTAAGALAGPGVGALHYARVLLSAIASARIPSASLRPLILRPSLMWDWGKLDVLPAIPVFWAASKAGVPFVDRPVQVNTIAKAVVEGLDNDDVQGVIRFEKMDELAARNQWEF